MSTDSTIPEALEMALAQVVAECRKEWERELELLRAERRALIAELRLAALGQPAQQPEPAPATPRAAKSKASR